MARSLAVTAALVSVGCDKGEEAAPAEAPKSEATAPEAKAPVEAEPTAEPETPKKSIAEQRRDKLSATFTALYCAQKRGDEADLLPLYKEHGYDSPAAWSTEWDKEATKNAEWAEGVITGAMKADCAKLGAPK
jgi:hypothetical protein